MNKKKIIIGISILIAILLVTVLIIIYKNNNAEESLDGYNYFISDSQHEGFSYDFEGDIVELQYYRTEIDSSLDIDETYNSILKEKFKLGYGVCDVYKDGLDRKYYFQYKTNKLCGYSDFSTENSTNNKITTKCAISSAQEFAKIYVETFDDYKYIECDYNSESGYYDVKWVRFIDGIETDDTISIWVNNDRYIIAFSNYKSDAYKNTDIDFDRYSKLLEQDKKSIPEKIKTREYTVTKECLSHNEEGKVSIAIVVTYTITNGIEEQEFYNILYYPIE